MLPTIITIKLISEINKLYVALAGVLAKSNTGIITTLISIVNSGWIKKMAKLIAPIHFSHFK